MNTYQSHLNFRLLMSLCLVAFFGIFSPPIIAAKKTHESIDRIIATINDTVITQSELQNAIRTVKKQISSSQMTLPPDADLRKQVLDQIINRKLQLQIAEQTGFSPSDKEIDNVIKQIAHQHEISVADIYQKISAEGMSKSAYRQEIREEIILQKIQGQEVAAKITVTPQEINDFMRSKAWQASNNKEYHLKDILIGLPDEPTSEQITRARKQANLILNQVHHGVKFSEAAMAESNNANALKGGDLGWRKLPEIPTAFANQVIQMKQGDIIGPIQTQNGFHIIHLVEIRNASSHHDLANQRKQVEQLIFQRKLEEGLQNWIMRLRSSASINLHPEN